MVISSRSGNRSLTVAALTRGRSYVWINPIVSCINWLAVLMTLDAA
jgi:hypothetical protein